MMYDILYYIYILFFGTYVSVKLACGTVASREWKAISVICPVMLIAQGVILQLWGIHMVQKLYPVIVHLPIVLVMILILKAKWDTALVSVMISYSLCQLLRWVGLMTDSFGLFPILSAIVHLALCHLLLLLLSLFCLGAIHDVIVRSAYLRKWFGALPILYYLYEYFMLYTQQRFAHYLALNELLPTAMLLFFVLFIIIYQREIEKREEAERQTFLLEAELSQAAGEIELLRVIEEKTAIYRHDLRHHLQMIDHMLATNHSVQASAYIREIVGEIESVAPVHYCENELVNLLISRFKGKAEEAGITMAVKAALPSDLAIPDPEFCVMIANGLENAINAVSKLPDNMEKRIDLFLDIKQNNLLMEIKNPYEGEVAIHNGLPVAKKQEKRHGCRSIQSIALRRKGDCIFEASNGVFILRIAIPLHEA